MQLVMIENQSEILPEAFLSLSDFNFAHLQGIIDAIKDSASNWDVILFLLVTTVLVFGSIIIFICSIKKIFKYQSDMEFQAREAIRKKKMEKHRHMIQHQKSIELETAETDETSTHVEDKIICDEIYDNPVTADTIKLNIEPPSNIDDQVFEQYPEPPPIDIDYSAIDVPDSFDMWPEPPAPIDLPDPTIS